MDQKDLIQKKKDLDKQTIGAIRLAIINDEEDKVFTYIEQLHFTASIKIVVKLANEMKRDILARRISMYVDEKSERDVMAKQYLQPTKVPANPSYDSKQMQMIMMHKTEEKESAADDLSKFAIKRGGEPSQVMEVSAPNESAEASQKHQSPVKPTALSQPKVSYILFSHNLNSQTCS